jgi:predicted DNA-binding antitoxin AbrB/MazE fold protein
MDNEKLLKIIADIVTESFRLRKSYERILQKVDLNEGLKGEKQINWYEKRITELLSNCGVRVEDFEGKQYDEGMAVTILNADEFNAKDKLIICSMIEPTILCGSQIVKTGTALLGRIT